jgi:hypothetical protein
MTPATDHVPDTRATLALRRMPTAGARLWLVRRDLGEAAAALGLFLLHHLPRLVGALSAAVHRHG